MIEHHKTSFTASGLPRLGERSQKPALQQAEESGHLNHQTKPEEQRTGKRRTCASLPSGVPLELAVLLELSPSAPLGLSMPSCLPILKQTNNRTEIAVCEAVNSFGKKCWVPVKTHRAALSESPATVLPTACQLNLLILHLARCQWSAFPCTLVPLANPAG